MLAAHSRKSIDRRLVLPLDAFNWPRALEVLNARYARRGRTPEHYQSVVRNMVEGVLKGPAAPLRDPHSAAAAAATTTTVTSLPGQQLPVAAPHSHHARATASAIDGIRAEAYAEEIPVSSSLWVTLLWAYCTLDEPQRALECLAEAERRFTFPVGTLGHMTEMLLPVLSRHGRLLEAEKVRKDFHDKTKAQAKTSSHGNVASDAPPEKGGAHQSLMDEQRTQRWMAEAAARAGDWKVALRVLDSLKQQQQQQDPARAGGRSRSINSLFHCEKEVSVVPMGTTRGDAAADGSITTTAASHPGGLLSRDAVRALFRALATRDVAEGAETSNDASDSVTERMLACWRELYSGQGREVGANGNATKSSPCASDVQCLMNGLAVAGRWRDVLDVFAVYYLGKPDGAASYLGEDTTTGYRGYGDGGDRLYGDATASPLPLDEVGLNLVFSCFPRREVRMAPVPRDDGATPAVWRKKNEDVPSLSLLLVEHPEVVVRLLNDLLLHRDDMVLTQRVMDAAGPALFQLGEYERCLELMRHSPCFATAAPSSPRAKQKGPSVREPSTPEEREARRRLVELVYAIHGATNAEMKYAAIMKFPFLFPPEVLKRLPAPDKMPEFVRAEVQRVTTAATAAQRSLSDEERYEQAMRSRRPTSVRPSRHHYFPDKPTTSALAESQERAMQRNFATLFRDRENAFAGKDAEADPRPIPKGLHDTASGWGFYGRGGEMVFANNKRIPHPFSMRPKVMRSLANPYRGWNPRLNSSLAHKEAVVKWNGHSSV